MPNPVTDIDMQAVIASIAEREQKNLRMFGDEHRRRRIIPPRIAPVAEALGRMGLFGALFAYLWQIAARPRPMPNLVFYSQRILVAEFPSHCISRALKQAGSDFALDKATRFDRRPRLRDFLRPSSIRTAMQRQDPAASPTTRLLCHWLFARFSYWFVYYRHALAGSDINAVVVHDDRPPHVLALACAAQSLGISVGLFRISDEHTRPIPPFFVDMLFCWNSAQQKAMSGHYREVSHLTRARAPMRALATDQRLSLAVVINAFYDPAAVKALCDQLARYEHVAQVCIRPHPRSDPRDLSSPSAAWSVASAEPLSALADRVDMAICGNSSVVVELLHLGVPVVHAEGLDAVPNDIYGYKASDVVPSLQHDHLDVLRINNLYQSDDWERMMEERAKPGDDAIGIVEAMQWLEQLANRRCSTRGSL